MKKPKKIRTLKGLTDEVIGEFDRILDNSDFWKPTPPCEVDWEKIKKFIRESCVKVAKKWKRLKLDKNTKTKQNG